METILANRPRVLGRTFVFRRPRRHFVVDLGHPNRLEHGPSGPCVRTGIYIEKMTQQVRRPSRAVQAMEVTHRVSVERVHQHDPVQARGRIGHGFSRKVVLRNLP